MASRTILHLTGMSSTKLGGLERYFVALARRCAASGYRTVLQYETLPRSAEYLRELRDAGASVVTVGLAADMLETVRRTSALLAEHRPEIVATHFVTPWVHLSLPVLARQHRVRRTVALVHSTPNLKRYSPRRFGLSGFDHVLGVSDSVARELRAAGVPEGRVRRHFLGLFDHEASSELRRALRAELDLPEPATVLGTLVFDAPVKGVDLLLEAFARVAPGRPELRLLVVGVEPSRSAMPALAGRLGIADRVRWAGIRDEGYRLMNAADLYVQPSRSEALAFAVLEAMALRLPVVATPVGGIAEVVEDGVTGFLARRPSAEAIAEAIERALARSAEWAVLGDAGRRRFEADFRGEASVDALANRYLGLPPAPAAAAAAERQARETR